MAPRNDVVWRLSTHVLAAAIVLVLGVSTAVAAGVDRPGTTTGQVPTVGAPAADAQQTSPNLLASSDSDFSRSAGGWTGRTATVGWTKSTGHRARGALKLTPTAALGAALSPTFPVKAGLRYTASAWIRTATKTKRHDRGVAPSLEFLDASGSVLPSATLVGQAIYDTTKWQSLLPVVGFAPVGAVRARVALLAIPSGAAHFVDEVTATETSGSPSALHGPLTTRGRDVIDANGNRVVLRGIEIEGLAMPQRVPVPTMLEEITAAHLWGANMIRLPLDQDRLVANTCDTDPAYLTTIRAIVAHTTSLGMLIQLDLHTFAPQRCAPPKIEPMPNAQSVDFWQTLATAFANDPLVAFDLFNEPHYVTDKVWRDGGPVKTQDTAYKAVGMQRIYDTVRATGADNLVLLSAPDYATTPTTYPLTGARNVVDEVHFYTCPTGLPEQKHACFSPGPHGFTDPSVIFSIWKSVTDAPLLMNEFGWPSANDGRYDRNVITNAENRGWAGWTAFTFDGSTGGLFDLVRNVGVLQQPTPRGMAVMLGLMRNQ